MPRLFSLSIGLATLFSGLTGMAANAAPPPVLQQEPLVQAALDHVPAMHSATLTVKASQAKLNAANGAYLPQVNVTAGVVGNNSLNPTSAATEPSAVTTGTLAVHQDLYRFGKTDAVVATATANLAVSEGALRSQAVAVAHTVRRNYVAWAEALGLEAQAGAQVAAAQHVYDQAQAFYRAGTRARLDVTRAKVTLAQAQTALIATQVATRQARVQLATAIGQRELDEGTPVFAPVPALATQSLADLEALGLKIHPNLATADARLAISRASLAAAQAADRPDLTADASAGGRARDLQASPTWQVGVSFGWPLYNGGAYWAQRDSAKLTEAAALQDQQTQRDQVLQDIDTAYLAVTGTATRVPAADVELQSARENLEQAEGRYRAGVGSIIEVSDAEAALATAEADRLKAEATYQSAIADLIAAVGLTGTEP